MHLKHSVIKYLIHEIEGYYETDHPLDRGGNTRYGITKKEVEKKGYKFSQVDYDFAVTWYSREYWGAQNLDALSNDSLRFRLFVDGVHTGATQPIKFLQRALNALNLQGSRWPDITDDGIIGQRTLHALNEYSQSNLMADGDLTSMCDMIRAQVFTYYLNIVRRDETQEIWFNGWKNRLKHSPQDLAN